MTDSGVDLPRPSLEQKQLTIPERPTIHLGDDILDFSELLRQRDPSTDKYTQKYKIKGIGNSFEEASLSIDQHAIDITIPGNAVRLKAEVKDQGILTYTLKTHTIDGQHYQGLPRGSEFFLAAYKFLSEQTPIHSFKAQWQSDSKIRDNYDAFESARAQLLETIPQHAKFSQDIALEENRLRQLKISEFDVDTYLLNDVSINGLANQDWNDLDERVKKCFNSFDSFTYFKFARSKIAEIEKHVNEAAAKKTWSGKMAAAIGFPHPQLVWRGPMIFYQNGGEYETQVVTVNFTSQEST